MQVVLLQRHLYQEEQSTVPLFAEKQSGRCLIETVGCLGDLESGALCCFGPILAFIHRGPFS